MRYNLDVEQHVIALTLIHAPLVGELLSLLTPPDFYNPHHQNMWLAVGQLHARGDAIDTGTLSIQMQANGAEDPAQLILECLNRYPAVTSARRYANTLIEHAQARRIQWVCAQGGEDANSGVTEPVALAARLIAELMQTRGADLAVSADLLQVEDWLAYAKSILDSRHDRWLIPGAMGHGERMIVVGGEGIGKMVLLRQMVQLTAAGIHPLYEGLRIRPVRTLLLDYENPLRALVQTLAKVTAQMLRSQVNPGEFYVYSRPGGTDLRSPTDRAQLEADLRAVRPELVVMGPLYKLFRRDPRETDEEAATATQNILDDLRTRYDFSLILEHHAPKGVSSARDMIPFGSSAWMRWPEYGISMIRVNKPGEAREVEIGRWRDDRIPAFWPERLMPGAPPHLWRPSWPLRASDDLPWV